VYVNGTTNSGATKHDKEGEERKRKRKQHDFPSYQLPFNKKRSERRSAVFYFSFII
jgi:hypothetical protein